MNVDDHLQITDLVSRYIHLVDDAAWDRLHEVFAEDGVCDFQTFGLPRLTGVDAIRDYFTTFNHPMAHHAVNTIIDFDEGGASATVRSKMLLSMHSGAMWSGEYRDRVVRTDAGWRFAERTAIRPRTLAART